MNKTVHENQKNYWAVLRSERAGFLALIFVTFLFAFEEFSFGSSQTIELIKIFVEPYVATGGIGAPTSPIPGVFTAFTLLIAFVTTRIALNSTKRFKWVHFLLFSGAILVQFGYWNALNRFFVPADYQTNLTSPPSFWIDTISRFFNPISLVSVAIFGGLLILAQTDQKQRWRGVTITLSLFLALGLSSAWVGFPNYASLSVPAFYRSMSQAVIGQVTPAPARDEIIVETRSAPKNNLVLIIDESIRRRNMSLYGYPRETTPVLDQLYADGKLGYWTDAISAATCSVTSNAVVITGLHQLPDKDRRLQTMPTIFHYGKAMGYTTHYFDGHSSTLWNSLTNNDLLFIDNYVNPARLKYPDTMEKDGIIGQELSMILNSGTGNLIVVNKSGVHAPYEKSFPPTEIIWNDRPPELAQEDFYDTVNQYDSAVRYNNTLFFKALFEDDTFLSDTTILYASDHGQNFGEQPANYSHCGSQKIEVDIPIVIIGIAPLDMIDFDYPAHHANLLPTLLDLMEVPAESRPAAYAPSLLTATAADATPRYYLPSSEDFFTGQPLLYDE